MPLVIPTFSTSVEAEQVIVNAEHGTLAPPVLFDMLSTLALRDYNISNPKERNMHLRELEDRPHDRLVETDLTCQEAYVAMGGLIAHFEAEAQDLQDVSERQWLALIDHATRRSAHDYPQA